jgi:hypothetical protein
MPHVACPVGISHCGQATRDSFVQTVGADLDGMLDARFSGPLARAKDCVNAPKHRKCALLQSRSRAKTRVNAGSAGGSRESCAKSDWLVERGGFEPPRPFDFTLVHRGISP